MLALTQFQIFNNTMAKEYENCLEALFERVNKVPMEDISREDWSVLNAAEETEYLGPGMYQCRVRDCASRFRTLAVGGRLVLEYADRVPGEQPCKEV
jgi:hypothetical protein